MERFFNALWTVLSERTDNLTIYKMKLMEVRVEEAKKNLTKLI